MARLRLLGSVVLEDDEGPVSGPAGRRHPLAILALLATDASRTLSRGKVVGLLWPEAPESTARNRLNTCLHQLRSVLGEDAILSIGDDLRLDTGTVDCDVLRFEEALASDEPEAAVECYGGPFLDGFALRGSSRFDHWRDRERQRLREAHRGALETLARRAEDRGAPERAAAWWRERARSDPYDSRVVAALMESLAAAGNRAEALRVADVHARLLEEELDVEPSAEVRELAGRLRSGAAPERGPDGVTGAPGGREATPSAAMDTGAAAAADAAPSGGEGEDAAKRGEDPRPRPRRTRPPAIALIVLAVLALAGLAGWYAWGGDGDGDSDGAASAGSASAEPSIAVLPFDPIGGDDAALFAEGIHGDLLTRIAQVSGVQVIAQRSMRRYADSEQGVGAIARELDVDWVLEGDVERIGDEVQINAQLIDPLTEAHVWAESYRRGLTPENLIDIQADLTRRIAGALEVRITGAEAERVERIPTEDLVAYGLHVEGRRHLEQRSEVGMRRAVDFFRRAIGRDSVYATAWAGLAEAHVLLEWYGFMESAAALATAEEAARRAVELDGDLAEAHHSLGLVRMLQHRGPESLRSLERSGYAGWFGWMHLTLGRLEEGIPHLERWVRRSPLSPPARVSLASGLLYIGDSLQRVVEHARRAREQSPDYPWAHLIEGQAMSLMGRHDSALVALRRGVEHASDRARPRHRGWLALAHAAAGDTARALELADRVAAAGHGYGEGIAHVGLGELEDAFEAFRRADWNSMHTPALRYHPALAPVREDPRWEALVGEVDRVWGLRQEG